MNNAKFDHSGDWALFIAHCLKRDLGSPLNCQAIDDVLERHLVLPLNSPPGYPRYKGSAERGMQDLKNALDEQHQRALMRDMPMAVELELATTSSITGPVVSWAG